MSSDGNNLHSKDFTVSGNTYKQTTKPYLQIVDEYKKLCVKVNISPSSSFINTLKNNVLNLFLDSYSLKEIQVMNKIIGNYHNFKTIVLAPNDVFSKMGILILGESKVQVKQRIQAPLTPSEKYKADKEQRDKEVEKTSIIYTIVQGIAKNLALSENINEFRIFNLVLKNELCEFLTEGLKENKSLKIFSINNCTLTPESNDTLLKSFLNHPSIEYLDLSSNNLTDGNMIGRIISRQTQRRDQTIWMHGLRNERPVNNDYTKGLISINLMSNNLGENAADIISTALSYDSYIRSVNLMENDFTSSSCKKFIKMLRKNNTLINVDMRNNPGYDELIHMRLIIKLSKNIKRLHKHFEENFYNEEEYNFIKMFINEDFFNEDVPEEVFESYNKRTKENLDEEINSPKVRESLQERRNKNKEQKLNAQRDYDEPDVEYSQEVDDQEHINREDQINDNDNQQECEVQVEEENILTDKKLDKDNEDYETYEKDNLDNLKAKNAILKNENLQLRKEILALRAQALQNKKNLPISNNSITAVQNISNNLEDPNTQLTRLQNVNLSLTGNLSSNQKLNPMPGEEASYEAYYNKIENLLSELTRMMDNVEINFRRNEN